MLHCIMKNEQTLKILFTISSLGKGGAERFLLDLITELDNYSNIKYKIAVCNKEIKYEEFINHPKAVFLNYQPFSLHRKNFNQKYTELLNDFQPDIIHANLFLGEFVTAYDVHPNIKYVCHGHDNMIQFFPLKGKDYFSKEKILHALEYRFLKKQKYAKVPTYFIANSEDTKAFYERVLPKNQQKNVSLIGLGFDYDKFYRPKTEIFPNKKLRLINVGSYQPKKNQTFAIDITAELKEKGVDFELNLIGFGSEYDNVRKKIEEKELTNYVFQRGLQSNVQEWYQNSDIYLHTAYYEPFGLVFLEAMAAGLPIVTLDGKGNRDIIENDKNGYLFHEQNATKFADKIIEIANNREKYQALSGYAQEYAKQFDVKIKTKELVEFYYSLVE